MVAAPDEGRRADFPELPQLRALALSRRKQFSGHRILISSSRRHPPGRIAVTLSLVLSTSLPLLTGAVALLWAGFVAPEREERPDVPDARDLRTW
jgi:hypothetical protein